MAVFTELTVSDVESLLKDFQLGNFVDLKPIAGGIENTNYFLDTTAGRWVLTVFERLAPEELPFYLELCAHLKAHFCPVAAPVRNVKGELFGFVKGKPFAIANRLTGEAVDDVNVLECASMGALLAQMHIAALDFKPYQENLRGFKWIKATAPKIEPHVPADLYAKLAAEVKYQEGVYTSAAYAELTKTACHCDLFRNNTLIADHGTGRDHVAGVFDFYFAGCSPWLFDLAVTVNDWCIDVETGKLDEERTAALLDHYNAVRPLTENEHRLWRDMLRAGALRFWTSRLFDFYLPRKASLLTPHDPTHFERVLDDRKTCDLYWPGSL